jgi:hypothetical protein
MNKPEGFWEWIGLIWVILWTTVAAVAIIYMIISSGVSPLHLFWILPVAAALWYMFMD